MIKKNKNIYIISEGEKLENILMNIIYFLMAVWTIVGWYYNENRNNTFSYLDSEFKTLLNF